MKTILNIANGALIYFVCGYSLLAPDWQAWVLMLFYLVAVELIELQVKEDLRKRMTPHLDNIENYLKRFQRG